MSVVSAQLVSPLFRIAKHSFLLMRVICFQETSRHILNNNKKELYSSSLGNKLPALSKMHYFQTYVNMKATRRTRQQRENVSKLMRRK